MSESEREDVKKGLAYIAERLHQAKMHYEMDESLAGLILDASIKARTLILMLG